MEEDDKGCPMIRMGVSGWMFLLVPAYLRSPGQKAVKRLCVCVCVCAVPIFVEMKTVVCYAFYADMHLWVAQRSRSEWSLDDQ